MSQTQSSTKRLFASTQAELSQAVGGVSVRTVRSYIAEGMPDRTEHGYDVGKCVEWWVREKLQPDNIGDRKKLAEAIDKERAGELKELDIQQRKGELIEVGPAKRFMARENARTKRKLLAFGSTISPILPESVRDQVIAEWDNSVRILLHEMAAIEQVDLKELA